MICDDPFYTGICPARTEDGRCVSKYHCSHKVEPPKPPTNADRIRSMSNEELAAFLTEVEYRRSAAGGGAKWKIVPNTLAWLHQPAEERKLCD